MLLYLSVQFVWYWLSPRVYTFGVNWNILSLPIQSNWINFLFLIRILMISFCTTGQPYLVHRKQFNTSHRHSFIQTLNQYKFYFWSLLLHLFLNYIHSISRVNNFRSTYYRRCYHIWIQQLNSKLSGFFGEKNINFSFYDLIINESTPASILRNKRIFDWEMQTKIKRNEKMAYKIQWNG